MVQVRDTTVDCCGATRRRPTLERSGAAQAHTAATGTMTIATSRNVTPVSQPRSLDTKRPRRSSIPSHRSPLDARWMMRSRVPAAVQRVGVSSAPLIARQTRSGENGGSRWRTP